MKAEIKVLNEKNIERAAEWLRDADCVLIGGGAGASTEAGNDYLDTVAFAKRYPALVKQGYSYPYQFIGKHDWTPAQMWGYLCEHVYTVHYNLPNSEVYQNLLRLVEDKNYFVITSNVDGLFAQHGFDEAKIYTPQGDFKYMQCYTPCTRQVWESKPVIEAALSFLDKSTQELTNPDVIPKCKFCGGAASMNVRGGDFFLHDPHEEQYDKFQKWLQSTIPKKLVILEIGAGFNTPTVIRHRMEHITRQHPSANMVRINMQYEELPRSLVEHGLGVGIRDKASPTFVSLLKLLGK